MESKTGSERLDALLSYETLIETQKYELLISEKEIGLIQENSRVFSGNFEVIFERMEEEKRIADSPLPRNKILIKRAASGKKPQEDKKDKPSVYLAKPKKKPQP